MIKINIYFGKFLVKKIPVFNNLYIIFVLYMNENLIEKELEILREAVKNAEKNLKQKIINTPDIKNIINIVEQFIIKKKLICYGGTAINNIISAEDQFYDKTLEIPDYDFFSDNAMEDAIELADIYYNHGYE